MTSPTPLPFELAVLGWKGRVERLMREKNLTYVEALKEILVPETSQDYDGRNARALQEVIDHMLSPEYLAKVSETMSEADPQTRAAKRADLMRQNFESLDLEALHRLIRDRNKELEAKGIIPPQPKL